MRIIAFSDSHGDYHSLERVVLREPGADIFIFLGDGEQELSLIKIEYNQKAFAAVCGNCDFYSSLPQRGAYSVSKHRIFYTHGHRYNVKSGTESLISAATNEGADIVLFGHTHCALWEYHDGIYLINPGSVSRPRGSKAGYAIIDITESGVAGGLVSLER